MRNQYKILSEKYKLVTEDDKEDIMTGLDYTLNVAQQLANAAYRFNYITVRFNKEDYPVYFAAVGTNFYMRVQFPHSYAAESNIVPVPASAKPLPNPHGQPDNIYYQILPPEELEQHQIPPYGKPPDPKISVQIFIKDPRIVQLILDYEGDDPVSDLEYEIDNYCGKHHILERVNSLPEVQKVAEYYSKNA